LQKHGVRSALDFARKPELWVKKFLTKPFYGIWQELNGRCVFPLITTEKASYQSIQKVKTFTPASCDRAFVFSQLCKNMERVPAALAQESGRIDEADIALLSPARSAHLNPYGKFYFDVEREFRRKGFRPLR
jgi:hypothetical protein